jgi:hypothetical protein
VNEVAAIGLFGLFGLPFLLSLVSPVPMDRPADSDPLRTGTTCSRPNGMVACEPIRAPSRLDHLTRWLAVNSDPPRGRRASMSMPSKNGLIVAKT